jgi:ubiquinol-cytochrome c reductase cytochrome b subunit
MLRAVPDPLGGLIVMGSAVAIFFVVPWLDRSNVASIRYKGIYSKIALVLFGVSFLTLGYLGTVGVTEVRKTMSVVCTVIYFAYFLLMPIYTKYEKTKEVPKRL